MTMYILIYLPPLTQETDQLFLLNTAQNGKIEIVELLIGRGADVDITDKVCESSMDSL